MIPHAQAWERIHTLSSHPLLLSLYGPLQQILHFPDFPSVEALDEILGPLCGVRFVVQAPTPRRRRPLPATMRYNGQVATQGVVPTRANSVHDLFNALVWAAFPLAKRALHERQHAAQGQQGEAPGYWVRSREQDWLSMLDEGGMVMVGDTSLLFGHALAEHLIAGIQARPLWVRIPEMAPPDQALAEWLRAGHWGSSAPLP